MIISNLPNNPTILLDSSKTAAKNKNSLLQNWLASTLEKTKKREEQQQKRFAEQQNSLSALKKLPSQIAASRKAALAQRMAQLKEQIQMMEKLAGMGGISAQQIKNLARELKSLVSQYASIGKASGESAAGNTSVNVSENVGENAGENVSANGSHSPENAENEESVEVNNAPEVSVTNAAAQEEHATKAAEQAIQKAVDSAEQAAKEAIFGADKSGASNDQNAQKNDRNVQLSNKNNIFNKISAANNGMEKADAAFMAEAKKLAERIKSLAKMLQQPTTEEQKREQKALEKELDGFDKTFEKAISALSAQNSSAMPQYNLGGQAIASVNVSPSISVSV